jgi:hypothetical protein
VSGQNDGPATPAETGEEAYAKAKSVAPPAEQLPDVDFPMFVLSLAHSAWVHLGDATNPTDGQREKNLPMARQTIDLLAMLLEKTRGNLDGDEETVLEQALYDLRTRYVEVAKAK